MGHGESLLISDANFPSMAIHEHVVRCDGVDAVSMLRDVLALFPLDTFIDSPAAVMQMVDKPDEDAPIVAEFQDALGASTSIERIERFAFYDKARSVSGILHTGETRLYGNIIIQKGVIGS